MDLAVTLILFLFAIVLTNTISNIVPKVPLPLLQIFLGVILTLIPIGGTLELEPEIFLLLIIAPLLFREGEEADVLTFWQEKKIIFYMAFLGVFITVFIVGFFTHFLFPAIPLAACFALGAILGPTDSVAAFSISKKMSFPESVLGLLEGEVLINDASGIIALQFATIALLTGAFSPAKAVWELIIMCLGGLFIGYLLARIKRNVTSFLQKSSVENMSIYMLIELLMPFLCYSIAEHFGFSGVFALVSAGSVTALDYKKVNLFEATLNTTKNTIWEMIRSVLNSLVFLILGMQLPPIIENAWTNTVYSHEFLILAIFFITALIFLIRFLCISFFTRHHSSLNEGKLHNTLLLTLSGAKGTVSLAAAFSLPILLNNGETFAARPTLLFITSGVIILSLLIAYIFLPILAEPAKANGEDNKMKIAILREVVAQLRKQVKESENLEGVILSYQKRIENLREVGFGKKEQRDLRTLRDFILQVEAKGLDESHASGEISFDAYRYYNKMLLTSKEFAHHTFFAKMKYMFKGIKGLFKRSAHSNNEEQFDDVKEETQALFRKNTELIVKSLNQMRDKYSDMLIDYLIEDRNILTEQVTNKKRFASALRVQLDNSYSNELQKGYEIEREVINEFLACGKINMELANLLRQNINSLESFAISDSFNPTLYKMVNSNK